MNKNYDVIFQKVTALVAEEQLLTAQNEPTPKELDEIDELRRFTAELMEREPYR